MSRLTPDSHQILHLLCTRLNALQGITSTPNLTLFLASVCSDWLALMLWWPLTIVINCDPNIVACFKVWQLERCPYFYKFTWKFSVYLIKIKNNDIYFTPEGKRTSKAFFGKWAQTSKNIENNVICKMMYRINFLNTQTIFIRKKVFGKTKCITFFSFCNHLSVVWFKNCLLFKKGRI